MLFDEILQRAHGDPLWVEGFELIAVAKEELELQLGVRGVILGLARGEGLAILGQRCGMGREEHQKVVLLQGIDERALGELQAHGNGLPLEALSQCTRPRLDGIGAVGQDAGLSSSGVGCLRADIVFGMAQSMPMKAANSLPAG